MSSPRKVKPSRLGDVSSTDLSKRLIVGNLLLSRDGRAVREGSSRALSFPADRRRFHQLRSQADLILIGGNTARNEPYRTTPVPLIVLSRSAHAPSVASNHHASVLNSSLTQALSQIDPEFRSILIEAGPSLIKEALETKLVETFYLTISNAEGDQDAPSYDVSSALGAYALIEEEPVDGGTFFTYSLAPTPE